MKKSEMIELIHNYTTTLRIPNGDMTIDEKILDIIEKAGMLPPFSSEIRQIDILDRWSVSTGKQQFIRVIEPLWDKEDE